MLTYLLSFMFVLGVYFITSLYFRLAECESKVDILNKRLRTLENRGVAS